MNPVDIQHAKVKERLNREIPLIVGLKGALVSKLRAMGFHQFDNTIDHGLVDFELKTDPYDKSQSLCAKWINARGEPCGNLQILGNGQLYAEFDLLVDHPRDTRWFIESITAWGRSGEIVTDLQLLESLGD